MAATSLDKLKVQLGIGDTSQDENLQLILDDVSADILAWTNRLTLPTGLEPTQRSIAVIRYNKQGAEGESSHNEGGISRSFEDLPIPLQTTVSQYRLLKAVRYATDA